MSNPTKPNPETPNREKPKTAALTMPSDPFAILSMQKLDKQFAEKAAEKAAAGPESDILTSRNQDILTDSNPAVQQDDKPASQMDHKTESNQDSHQEVKPAGRSASKMQRQPAGRPVPSPDPLDPVDQALLQKLARAYPDLAKGRATLVSSRLPDDIVERLGLAADLVKKHKKSKQDVITRGLILAFEELVRQGGDVDWYE